MRISDWSSDVCSSDLIVVAVDHGFSANPDSVIAQIQGAALFALTAALKGEITIKDGRVEQSNFHDYPAIMLAEVPPVDVFLIPGDQIPGGAGEIGVPVIAPALTASVFGRSAEPTFELQSLMR